MRILLVGNPAAAVGRGRARIARAEVALAALGASVTTVLTERRGHARDLLADPPKDVDRVVACGGDGLVSEVASALAGGDLPVAIVPAGRGNDLARGLGLPLSIEDAAGVALSRRVERIDLGRCNERTYCTVAACGIDADVSRRARVSRLRLPGLATYVVHALAALARFTPLRARVVIDGVAIDEDCFLVAVANTSTYGAGFRIAPGATPLDGRLDACIVRRMGALRAVASLPAFFAGRHDALPEVTLLRGEHVAVDASPAQSLEADGEPLAETPAIITCQRAALPVALAGR